MHVSEAIEAEESRAVSGGLEQSEWRILRAIRHGAEACCPVPMLLRVAGLGEPAGTAERAFEALRAAKYLDVWSPRDQPERATFSPWGAEELGTVLVEPARDDPEGEPRWGIPEEQPRCRKIEPTWGAMKRSRAELARVLAARAAAKAAAQQRKHPGKAKLKRARKGHATRA